MDTPPTVLPDTSGSDQACWFSEQVHPHEAALRRYLRARFPRMDTDDLVQESYLRILRARAVTPILNAKSFLFATARNTALNLIRHDRHENREALREMDPSAVIDDKVDILESVSRRQDHELLREAVQSLPRRAKEVFVLRRIHGKSLKEIAETLGISEKTAETHISLALKRCADFVRNADARARVASRAVPRELNHPEVRHA